MQGLSSILTTATLGTLLAASGCSKQEDASGTAASAGSAQDVKQVGSAAPAAAPDFAAWDVAGKRAAWTGSWIAKENGSWQAWTVAADGKIAVQNGEQAEAFTLEVAAPCVAYFASTQGAKYPRPFTVTADGKLRASASGGGYRKGSAAIFCDPSGTIFTLAADGTCTAWKDDFGKWVAGAGECSLAKSADGKDVFKHGEPNGGEFTIEGDAIVAGTNPSEPAADHEAAKTAAVAKAAAK